MSLHNLKMPSLKDKLAKQAEEQALALEKLAEEEEKKKEKETKGRRIKVKENE